MAHKRTSKSGGKGQTGPSTSKREPGRPGKGAQVKKDHRAVGKKKPSGGSRRLVRDSRSKGPGLNSTFLTSVDRADALAEGVAEIAFCGRSNVGKSSLLNALTGRRSLARTSKTPGRTQRINIFDINEGKNLIFRLVDMPGYGHASVPSRIRRGFGPMIESYLLERASLVAVAVLIDARRDVDQEAASFIMWLQAQGIRVELVITKMDKIPRNRRLNRMTKLAGHYGVFAKPWQTSCSEGLGIDELRQHLMTLCAKERQGK